MRGEGLVVFHDEVLQLLEGAGHQVGQLVVEAAVEDFYQLAQVLVVLLVGPVHVELDQVWTNHFF